VKKKEPAGTISLQIPAHQANPSPPVGPALGQRGLNIMDFCKKFNDICKEMKYEPGDVIPVVITYYPDKSFTIITKLSPVPNLIKKKLGLKSASKTPGTVTAGKITRSMITEIAKMKMKDMNVTKLSSAESMVAGTCVSMGIEVIEG
jgi:large subunit ribosomal protein L11